MDNFNAYPAYVCGTCKVFACKANEKSPQETDVYICQQCNNYNDIRKVMVPYSFKLFLQELRSMNIVHRITIKKPIDIFNNDEVILDA